MIKGVVVITLLTLLVFSNASEAGWLFHATKNSVAKRIMQRGFQVSRMKPTARLGRGVYASQSKALALKERPTSDAVVFLKDTKMLQRRSINTGTLSKEQLKKLSGDIDLRGNIHKGVIGPDLGKNIGKYAGKNGNAVVYQSAKGKGYNFFIPKTLYQKYPHIVEPQKIQSVGQTVKYH